MVPRKPKFIRLKSCYGKYLTASESSFLLGMTGAKVIQTPPFRQAEHESDWEPIREESTVKLMSWNEKYLRGNGGAPPWRNSVTCDREPHISATKKWILWSVEVVENPDKVLFADRFSSPASSFNSSVSSDGSNLGSPGQKLLTFGSSESIGSDPGSLVSVSSSKLMFTPSRSGTLSPKPTEVRFNSNSYNFVTHYHNILYYIIKILILGVFCFVTEEMFEEDNSRKCIGDGNIPGCEIGAFTKLCTSWEIFDC